MMNIDFLPAHLIILGGTSEHDWIATGLPSKGWSFMRESQSIAFFKPPGIDQLYSGASEAR
jgi:hypothetical protein